MGHYLYSNLNHNEKIVRTAKVSVLARPTSLAIIILFLLSVVTGFTFFTDLLGLSLFDFYFFSLIIVMLCSLRAITPLFSTELALTTQGIIARAGLVNRTTLKLNFKQINAINIEQSQLGQRLNYGVVCVVDSDGTVTSIPSIKQPLKFKQAFDHYLALLKEQKKDI